MFGPHLLPGKEMSRKTPPGGGRRLSIKYLVGCDPEGTTRTHTHTTGERVFPQRNGKRRPEQNGPVGVKTSFFKEPRKMSG